MKITIHSLMDADRAYSSPRIETQEGEILVRFSAKDDDTGNLIFGELKALHPDAMYALKSAIETIRTHLEKNIKP